ncbi:TetR family transcriptional regulator [Chitinophaga oryziterrae]|uniref:TetR family transcriptional regulator n=1 Tax=Chitinophaga oryziterrae TaxID=1031224 RepID=A0A6N8JBI8_9BACT|nr:TetR/AcrR family transcriptional regulator [Chitinophaga oryziterrae]MVT42590.1 TetR family transcriptional regulator [Chitinophaga oryziterrae]
MEYNQKQISILEAAEQLFASQGFHGTSVRDIAHEADVNIAMISYYFGSKEKLIEAIFLKRIHAWKLVLEDLLKDNTQSFEARFDGLVETYVQRVMSNPCFHLMMIRAQIQIDIKVNELIHENKKEVYEVIKNFIIEGQEKGVFNDVDIMMMVSTLTGTTNHIMSTRHHFQRLSNLEHLSDEQLQEYLIIHISTYLKKLFKAILIHEA